MPFRIIPTGNGFIMQDEADDSYVPGVNCKGTDFMQAANDHIEANRPLDLEGFMNAFRDLLGLAALAKTQKPKPKKQKPKMNIGYDRAEDEPTVYRIMRERFCADKNSPFHGLSRHDFYIMLNARTVLHRDVEERQRRREIAHG